MPTFEERFWEKYKRVPGPYDYTAEIAIKDRTIEKLRNALMDVLAIDNFMALDTVRYASRFENESKPRWRKRNDSDK